MDSSAVRDPRLAARGKRDESSTSKAKDYHSRETRDPRDNGNDRRYDERDSHQRRNYHNQKDPSSSATDF